MARKQPQGDADPKALDVLGVRPDGFRMGRGRRSRLYAWMRRNHDTLAAEFDRAPPSWTDLAQSLARHGLMNGVGSEPTSEGVRKVWYRVRTDVSAARERRADQAQYPSDVSPLPQSSAPISPADDAMPPRPVAVETDVAELPRQRFQLATLKGMEPDAPAPKASASSAPKRSTQAGPDVDAVLAEFTGRPASGGFRPRNTQGED